MRVVIMRLGTALMFPIIASGGSPEFMERKFLMQGLMKF